jgi:hypothetical protein
MARKDEGQVMHTWAGLRNARPLTHRMTWLQPPLAKRLTGAHVPQVALETEG